ncbi:MAG: 2OG-Fe(II) oxygenase family protein [Acidiferrobacterales bacterium]
MVEPINPPAETSEVVPLFPTCIWKTQLWAEHYEPINGKIKKKLDELRAGKPGLRPGEKWQTDQGLHKLEEFQDLVVVIRAAARGVFDFLHIVYEDFHITGCWANISAVGTPHKTHMHPNNYLSGVYYVQIQGGADTITFEDPRPQTYVIAPGTREDTAENLATAHLSVKEGMIVLFPAWLPHSVPANQSAGERISVAFNIMFSAFGEKMSHPQWQGNLPID